MGCASRYCIVCGGPFYAPDRKTVREYYIDCKTDELQDNGDEIDWNKGVKNIKREVKKIFEKYPLKKSTYGWLCDLYLITSENEIIDAKGNDYDTCSHGEFIVNGKKFQVSSLKFTDERKGDVKTIVCHKKCYNYLVNKFDYKLLYTDIMPYVDNCYHLIKPRDFYLDMYEYIDQYHQVSSIYITDSWLLDITDPKNQDRLLAMWSHLTYKIKLYEPKYSGVKVKY